jgi:iron complex outermembrane receptor protein
LVNRPDLRGGLNPELKPTRGVTGEIGVRNKWSNRVLFEVNGWITELDDELVPFEDELQPGRVFFRNAGASKYAGIEALLRAVLVKGVGGRMAYTFTDATFKDFDVDGRSFDGNLVPGVARHRIDAVLSLAWQHWYGEVRGDFVGRIAANDSNSEFARSYAILELRTGLDELPVGRLKVSPFLGLANLFDRWYSASVSINAFGGRFFEPGPGRSIFAGLGVLF